MLRVLPLALLVLLGCDPEAATAPDAGAPVRTDGGQDAGPEDGGAQVRNELYEALDALRTALGSSPNLLRAEAERVIATRDPDQMAAFVRDRIQTLLPRRRTGSEFARSSPMGWRGALRSGAGMPRDKAELLMWMLTEAGFSPEERRVRVPAGAPYTFPNLFRPRTADASDDALETALARWATRLAALPRAERLQPEVAAADWVARFTTTATAPPSEAFFRDALSVIPLPMVRIQEAGETRLLDPFFSASVPETTLDVAAGPAGPPDQLRVRVWARTNLPGSPIELVERTWDLKNLVGRRVLFQAPPILDLDTVLRSSADALHPRLPVLQVRGSDLSDADAEALAAAGPIFFPTGAQIEVSDTGSVSVSGQGLGDLASLQAEPTAEDRARAAQVRRVNLDVDASGFPEVEVRFDVQDERGVDVAGLHPQLLDLTEEAQPVTGYFAATQRPRRVLFVFDLSGSIPTSFRGAPLVALAERLATRLLAEDAVEVAATNLITPLRALDWTNDVATFTAAAAALNGSSSNGWAAALAAVAEDPTAVVIISDGEFADSLNADQEAALRASGVPILGIDVDETGSPEPLAQLSELTGGAYRTVANARAAEDEIVTLATARRRHAYRFRYLAERSGPTARTVALTVGATEVSAIYTAPSVRGAPRALIGIYVDFEVNNQTVTRTVAGLPSWRPESEATEAHRLRTVAALSGRVQLSVEPGRLRPEAMLADWLDVMLSYRDIDGLDFEALVTHLGENALELFPTKAALLQTGLGDLNAVHPLGPSLVVQVDLPGWEAPGERRLDLLPFFGAQGYDDSLDVQLAFAAPLRATLELGAVEAGLTSDNAFVRLDARQVEATGAGALRFLFDGEVEEAWQALLQGVPNQHLVLHPANGEPWAAFSLNPGTGSALSLMPGGEGGGAEDLEARLRAEIAVAEIMAAIASLAGVGGGAWVKLEIAKAKVVADATMRIATLGSGGYTDNPDWDPERVAEDYVRGLLTDMAMARISPALGRLMSRLGDAESIIRNAAALRRRTE